MGVKNHMVSAKHDLRKLARGQPCMVRLPGCDGGGETTILAHYRIAGECGMGMKPPDLLGAWACASCHDHIDRRNTTMEYDFVRWAHAEACLRSIAELVKMGVLKW